MELISVESSQFKHQQVESGLRQLVATLPIGARLPSERSLALTHGVNFLTVRRALKSLVLDGTVTRKVGSGTFVTKHRPAAGSRGRGRGRLGVLTWQNGGGYAHRVAQGIALGADTEGVELRSAWIRDFGEGGLAQARLLEHSDCEAIILPWFPHEHAEEAREFVQQSPLPVSLPLLIPGLEANCFEREDVFGGNLTACCEQLCDYFQLLGLRQIAFLGPDMPEDPILQHRLTAYAGHRSRAGLAPLCGLVRAGGREMDDLAEQWREHRGALAVVSYDDEHALRFLTAMHKLGLSAPGDFRIIGQNNTEAGVFSDPPLTTIRQDFGYVGRWLIKHALALARGASDQSTAVARPELLIRASCGGADQADAALKAQLPGLKLTLDNAAAR